MYFTFWFISNSLLPIPSLPVPSLPFYPPTWVVSLNFRNVSRSLDSRSSSSSHFVPCSLNSCSNGALLERHASIFTTRSSWKLPSCLDILKKKNSFQFKKNIKLLGIFIATTFWFNCWRPRNYQIVWLHRPRFSASVRTSKTSGNIFPVYEPPFGK